MFRAAEAFKSFPVFQVYTSTEREESETNTESSSQENRPSLATLKEQMFEIQAGTSPRTAQHKPALFPLEIIKSGLLALINSMCGLEICVRIFSTDSYKLCHKYAKYLLSWLICLTPSRFSWLKERKNESLGYWLSATNEQWRYVWISKY